MLPMTTLLDNNSNFSNNENINEEISLTTDRVQL